MVGLAMRWLGAVVAVVVLLSISTLGLADWDPPGPPPLEISIAVEEVHFTESPDDGWNGKAELTLFVFAKSTAGRGYVVREEEVDVDAAGGIWRVNATTKLGFECSPPSVIELEYALFEDDSLWGGSVRQAILSAFSDVLHGYAAEHFVEREMSNSDSRTLELLILDWDKLDPSKEAGKLHVWRGEGLLSGREITLKVIVNEIADSGQCGASGKEDKEKPTEVPTGEPGEGKPEPTTQGEVSRAYKPLHDVYWKIGEIKAEGGTSRLSRAQLERIQRAYMSQLLGSAAVVALDYIMRAVWEAGDATAIEEAWHQFMRGEKYAQAALRTRDQEDRDVYMDRAITAYERAAEAAARALAGSSSLRPGVLATIGRPRSEDAFRPASGWQGLPTAPSGMLWASQTTTSRFELPLYLLLFPDYLVVRKDSTTGIIAWVVGGEGEVKLSVTGAPEGMKWEVRSLEGVPGLFAVDLDTQGVPAGGYELTVTATRGGKSVSREFTLWVED